MAKKKIDYILSNNQSYYCNYCNLPFDATDSPLNKGLRIPTRDHFIPYSKGGRNAQDNIYIVCQYCNLLKGDFLPEEFIYWLGCKIKHKQFPDVHGKTYNERLLEVIKENVKAIYDGKQNVIITQQYPTIKQINKAVKKLGADAHLSVNNNTYKIKLETKEELVERLLAEPQLNFHEEYLNK